MAQKTVLLLTDFSYPAKGREYFREDLELSVRLRTHFKVWTSHIEDSEPLWDRADQILIRNTGPQQSHREALMRLKDRGGLPLFNDLKGKGDIKGKQHLLDLYASGFPVIPTFNSLEKLKNASQAVFQADRYILKPIDGADSSGIKVLTLDELASGFDQGYLVQPLLDFVYEVSFYFIGDQFQYALYAPNPEQRWVLKPYSPTDNDIAFARLFIAWNSCKLGIQRVDACRLKDNSLLLMELEDYNPFLSLDLLEKSVREQFMQSLCAALNG